MSYQIQKPICAEFMENQHQNMRFHANHFCQVHQATFQTHLLASRDEIYCIK